MSAPPPPATLPPRRSTGVIVVAVALVMAIVLIGGSLAAWATWTAVRGDDGPGASPPEPSSTVEMPSYDAALAQFYEQELDWRTCGSDECTRLEVPLDYADPDGRTIELAVLRAPASRRSERVGQLMVNPGGPGGSAVDYAGSGAFTFGGPLTRYFDIVGMDPRGVGESTPLECGDTEQTDEFAGLDPDPDNPDEVTEYDDVNREFGESCVTNSGDLASHMGTIEAAKDMDILRAALGERQVDYLGASYGTLLGATYAELFPHNVRRMVLDGALDPTLSNEQLNLGQARGFETALTAYVEYCIGEGNCVLGDDVDAAKQRIRQLLDDLDSNPLPTSSGRQLTEGLGRYGVVLPLYLKAYWPILTIALTQAIRDGSGDQLLAISDQYTARGPDSYTDNSFSAFWAVSCLDYPDSVPAEKIAEPVQGVRRRVAHVRPPVRLRPRQVRRLAGQGHPHAGRHPRRRRATDRGDRYDARPGHAVRLGPGTGLAARLRPADHPRRRRPHRLPAGQRLRRQRGPALPRRGQGPEGEPLLLSPVPGLETPHPAPLYSSGVPGSRGRALRRLSSVGRASHS